MFKIIDRYIIKYYLGTFFFMVILLGMLAMVIDFSEKVEDFMEQGGPSLYEILFDYYLNFLPFIISMLFPLCALISVIFFTSRLASNSEIISMIGNGISFYRVLVPYITAALIIAGLHYVGNHYIFPMSNKKRVAFENTYIWKHNYEGPTENIHLLISQNEEIYLKYFNRKDSSGRDFSLMRYDSTGVHRPYHLLAKRIELIEHPNRWRLHDFRIRTIDGMKEELTRGQRKDTTINLRASDMVRRDNLKETMTTNELIEYIDGEKRRGSGVSISFEVERYRRTAYPFAIIILTLIGVSVSSRKMRGGMGWHLVIGMALSAMYIFTLQFSTTFSTNAGFSPILGAWIPNMIFAVIAIFMVLKAQK